MSGWSGAIADLAGMSTTVCPLVVRDDQLLAKQQRSARMRSALVNFLLASLYLFFVYSSVKSLMRTGSLVGTGILAFNTLAMVCLLVRRNPSTVTGASRNWIIAPLTLAMPFLMRPVGSSWWPLTALSSAGQIAGLAVMIAGLISLNRSVGIVAANRGVKTRGVYAWVRHPMYAGEILFLVSFLLANWCFPNMILASAIVLAQVVRSFQEEALLLGDESYTRYRSAVRYRFVPGVV